MEPPTGFDAAAIRTKKAELFAAVPAVTPARAVRGQIIRNTEHRGCDDGRKESNRNAHRGIDRWPANLTDSV